jgi:hypothetical protein
MAARVGVSVVGNHPRKPRYQGEGAQPSGLSNHSEREGVLRLPATASQRLEAIAEISNNGKRINGLCRLMEPPERWLQA